MAKHLQEAPTPGTTTRRPSLFHLAQDQQALAELLTEVGGDVSEESVAAAVDQWVNEIETNVSERVEKTAQVIRHLELMASVADAERERLAKLRDVRGNAAQRLKDRLKQFMETTGRAKIETDTFRVSIANNGGRPALDVDFAKLPDAFVEYVPRVKTDDIQSALTAGQCVPGVTVKPRGTHLRIT